MRYFRFAPWVVILLWMPVILVSLNHLLRFSTLLVLPLTLCGILFFFAIVGTLFYLTQPYILEVLYIGAIFWGIGWLNGPFLEPPGDPLDHLANSYYTCDRTSKNISKANGGLWHYSMNGLVLCSEDPWSQSHQNTVLKIRFLHSAMMAFLAAGLYAVGKSAGLTHFWAGFAVTTMLLFMGTNRFSYFGYYSLADSSSSLLIYWMWIAAFFFKLRQTYGHMLLALVSAIVLIPILYVNHVQEAIFLGLICVIYLLIQFLQFVFSQTNKKLHWTIMIAIVLLLFVCPQFEMFRNMISPFFKINDWERNQHLVVYLGPIHLMGKIWSFRVNDTLGLMGILAIPAAIALIWMAKKEVISYKVAIVGILPLLVYCIPLLHYIWLSNCRWLPTHTRYYYRICYASLFGVTFAYLCYQIEYRFLYRKREAVIPAKNSHPVTSANDGVQEVATPVLNNSLDPGLRRDDGVRGFLTFGDRVEKVLVQAKKIRMIRKVTPSFKVICLTGLILLSIVRSGPVYGKMDFLTLDTNPWWPLWQPMLEELPKQKNGKPIYTDATTGFVLNSVFNYPILEKGPRPRKGWVDLNNLPNPKKFRTLVNLKGLSPSWVAQETRHWRPQIGNTEGLYSYQGEQGVAIKSKLARRPMSEVQIFD